MLLVWLSMLLLLDGHFSQDVSRPLRTSDIDALTLDEWHNGRYRHASDHEILEAAFLEKRTLVTYDVHTMPGFVAERGERGQAHAGVIYVSSRTIHQGDCGGQIRALRRLVDERGDEDWRDQTTYLRPA